MSIVTRKNSVTIVTGAKCDYLGRTLKLKQKEGGKKGGETAGRGRPKPSSQGSDDSPEPYRKPPPPARDIAAAAVGVSPQKYERAKAVVAAAEREPEVFAKVVEEMDSTGNGRHRMTFAEKLRELRDAKGLSEAKLAELSGLTFGTIHGYELVAIGRAIEERERKAAEERQKATRAKPGNNGKTPNKTGGGTFPPPETPPGKTRDAVASTLGVSGKTYEKAKAVVAAAEREPEVFAKVVEEMDSTGNGRHRMTFAEKLRELRDAKGLSEAKLAELSGLTFGTIHGYGLGRRAPSFSAVVKLAAALGVDCSAFAECEDVRGEPEAKPAAKRRGKK